MRLVDPRPALALCLVVTFAVPAAAFVSFNTTEEEEALDGSDNPQALTIADVNGDGVGDIIAAQPLDDSVMVFYNDGTGQIDFDDFFDTDGTGPVAVATGLFNGDNFIDIVTANNEDGTVSILLNDVDGEGNFNFDADPRRFQVAANPIGIAVGKFNGDNIDDLAVLSPDLIYLLQGNGDGTFSAFNPPTISTRTSGAFAIKAGLINGDNILDLVITDPDGPNKTSVFLGTGTGSFNFNGNVIAGSAPTGLVIADANGDLLDDLITVDSQAFVTSELLYSPNAGDGTFGMTQTATGPEESVAITSLDVEPDGKVDLAITSALDDEMFLLCQLSDECTQPPFGGGLEAGIWRSAIGGTIPGCRTGGQVAIASGKLNDDSMDDLVALRGDLTTLCIMINRSQVGGETPTPIETMATATPSGPTATPTITPTRTNTATPTEVPTIALGNCPVKTVGGESLGRPVSVTTDDFNRDGTRDVAVADAAGNRIVILLTTVGAPGEDRCAALSLTLGASVSVSGPRVVVASDLDVDGSADLAVIGSQGLSVFYGNGNGGFVPGGTNPIPAGTTPSDIALTDLNRDLTPDLIISDMGSENISIFIGTRQRAQPFTGRCPMAVNRPTNKVVSADLNVDGRYDFAVSGPQTRDIGVFLQIANAPLDCGSIGASFQGQTTLNLPSGSDPTGLEVGVFAPTDTVPDLVVSMTQNNANGTVLLFEGRPAGTGVTYVSGTVTAVPTPKTGAASFAAPSAIGKGDIERDGRLDVVLTDLNNDSLAEFRGQNNGTLGVPLDPLILGAGTGPVDLTVADIDHDGRDDVVTANADDGSVSYLISGLRAPTPTPTDTPIPTPTTPAPTAVGTATSSPTISPTPTRSRRPTSTASPMPTNTQRGVVTLSGGGCSIDQGSQDSGMLMLAAFGLIAFARRRRALGRSPG